MLFCIGFLFQFLIAGLTGIMLSSAPFDWQLSGSYFVVAHFHYVIVGGILFALFAAFYYWYPKMTGRMLNETLGNCISGCSYRLSPHLRPDAHSRNFRACRADLYLSARRGWNFLNLLVTIGAFIQGMAILCLSLTLFILTSKDTRGQRSVGRLDSRMGGTFAASCI